MLGLSNINGCNNLIICKAKSNEVCLSMGSLLTCIPNMTYSIHYGELLCKTTNINFGSVALIQVWTLVVTKCHLKILMLKHTNIKQRVGVLFHLTKFDWYILIFTCDRSNWVYFVVFSEIYYYNDICTCEAISNDLCCKTLTPNPTGLIWIMKNTRKR